MSKLISLVGKGVSLTAEYREHRKEVRLQRESSSESQQAQQSSSSRGPTTDQQRLPVSREPSPPAEPAPPYTAVNLDPEERSFASDLHANDDKESAALLHDYDEDEDDYEDRGRVDDLSTEDDEEAWELDEAPPRKDLDEAPPYEATGEDDYRLVREVLDSELRNNPDDDMIRAPLPYPVILPQRRPGKKSRGFVRAYAPLLGECSGIDQETFLEFLENFDKSSQASPVFGYVQIAAGIASFAPSITAMIVTTAVQIGAQAGEAIQERSRTNGFLDKMNEELFKPRGLYAMIIKYKSDAQAQQSGNPLMQRFGICSGQGGQSDFDHIRAIAKYDQGTPSGSSSGWSVKMQQLRAASGKTHGAQSLPESAPLVFPYVDRAIATEGPETLKDKSRDAKQFLTGYIDRRAQMKYAMQDPDSSLVVPEEHRTFRSQYSNPDHPMFNGGIIGLVSGGRIDNTCNGAQRGQRGAFGGYDRADMMTRMDHDGRMSRRERTRAYKTERQALRAEERMDSGRRVKSRQLRAYNDVTARDSSYVRDDYYNDPANDSYDQCYDQGSNLGGRAGRRRLVGRLGRFDQGSDQSYSSGSGLLGGVLEGRHGGRLHGRRGGEGPIGLVTGLIGAAMSDRGDASAQPATYGHRGEDYHDEDYYGDRMGTRGSCGERGILDQGNTPADSVHHGGSSKYLDEDTKNRSSYDNGTSGIYSNLPVRPSPFSGSSSAGGSGIRNEERRQGGRGSRGGGSTRAVKRFMNTDVLYLLIVNMPTEAELAEARELLASAEMR